MSENETTNETINEIEVYLGTEMKLSVSIDPVNNLTMDEYDFECEFFCHPNRRVKRTKLEMLRENSNSYIALLKTRELGTGSLHCTVSAFLPDTYGGPDWERTEVWSKELNIFIKPS